MLFRKLWRTMWSYKAQFLSMIIMIAIGVGIFLGMNMEWYSLEQDTAVFFESTGFADYRIVSERGFSALDAEKILEIDGVTDVSRFISVNVDVTEQEGDTLTLAVTENPSVSGFLINEGSEYDETSEDGLWLSEKYAAANGVQVGDTLTLSYSSLKMELTVQGLIQSSEFMICVRDESQLMPDYNSHGFAYISPQAFKKAAVINYYPLLHVRSELGKNEFTDAVDEALGSTELILTKDETISYAQAMGEAEEGKIMGTYLPIIFLLIAILTMVTTMHRLTLKERTQIGTLKALGFKDRKILRHYTSYAVMVGFVGMILGVLLGYGIAWFIMNENGAMGTYLDMPEWKLYIPGFCYVVMVVIFILIVIVGWYSVKNLLRGNAADTLREDFSEKQKNLRIEKTKWFHRLSFGTRWNMRDIARHKSRTAMSLLGVIGCTIIIIAVLGMSDTMDAFLDSYFNEAALYESRIYLGENVTEQQIGELAAQYEADSSQSISVQLEDKAVSLDIYNIENGLLKIQAEKNGTVELTADGAYICTRISDEFNLEAGDTITVSPYGTDDSYMLQIAGISRSLTESISISQEYAESVGIEYRADSLYTLTQKSDIEMVEGINTVQSKQMIIDSFDSFMQIMNMMIGVMIVAGVLLGIIVLYNLGVMSYAERYREMATLKVLGFKDKKIGGLLIGQNMWLSIIGIIIGLPLGVLALASLMKALATEYELVIAVNLTSYLITILITIGMSLLVSLMVSRKNKYIDMVAALKSAE